MMGSTIAILMVVLVASYGFLFAILHATQSHREPRLLPTKVPFLDAVIGIAKHKANYLLSLRQRYRLPIHTIRMPFQRFYVVSAPSLIQAVQSKANLSTFVPTLLDFGMLFSGLTEAAKETLREAYGIHGNGFTKSVHKYLSSGATLQAATRTAVEKLAVSIPNNFAAQDQVGLFEALRRQLTVALTSAIYGPENPYDDPAVVVAWQEFVPGINHLLYSPFPQLTACKALNARARVIKAFERFFESGGHTQAFAMVPEMHTTNRNHGLSSNEAAKLEMATSLALLSSGAITAFWLIFHIVSDPAVLLDCRREILSLVFKEVDTLTGKVKVVNMSNVKNKCPALMAMWHETLRYHSTVINVKKVQHSTTLASEFFLKKDSILMIPGAAVHHDTEIWGPSASSFDHTRFFSNEGTKKLSSTSAFRPFGAGTTMCPGRHFSTNTILSLAAMVLLQFDIEPVGGHWHIPTKMNADMWNAMPKPDQDIPVKIAVRSEQDPTAVEWKFVWGETEDSSKEKSPSLYIPSLRKDAG